MIRSNCSDLDFFASASGCLADVSIRLSFSTGSFRLKAEAANRIRGQNLKEKNMKKYRFGNPIATDVIKTELPVSSGVPETGTVEIKDGTFTYRLDLKPDDVVYGLGETVRGINKRGWEYDSWATDDPEHDEDKRALYGAHNFLIVDGEKPFGLFIDQPGRIHYDIGYSKPDEMVITSGADLDLYVIEGGSPYEISRTFRKMIAKSYVAPRFGFGYNQSRWGYSSSDDLRKVADTFDELDLPLDMVSMDIDYMVDYKDFTVNEKEFDGNFPAFVKSIRGRNLHLVPNVDAAIKQQAGYPVYEEGVQNNYFCKLEDHQRDFIGAVWPGYACLPDFLNDQASEWFGNHYKELLDAGVDAYWNDMNEPALFYSKYSMDELKKFLADFSKDDSKPRDCFDFFELGDRVRSVQNSEADYKRFYHHYKGDWIRHDLVHNLYGTKMTKSAADAFKKFRPDERVLLFSRSSAIGAHEFGGIWTGDNKSWWSHLDLLIHQLPAINMSGFLYTGADLGGFGADTTEDLVLRFMQIGLFTPLMRNHSALGSREQEPYQFQDIDGFRHLLKTRYSLIPYLYSEYMKAALEDDLMFRPLAFDFPEDPMAKEIEDQLMLGHELMIAPVTKQNSTGRTVYLPEEMMKIHLKKDGSKEEVILPAGWHYISYPVDDVVFFIRKGKAIPFGKPANRTADLETETLELIGYPEADYFLYEDDGISLSANGRTRRLRR